MNWASMLAVAAPVTMRTNSMCVEIKVCSLKPKETRHMATCGLGAPRSSPRLLALVKGLLVLSKDGRQLDADHHAAIRPLCGCCQMRGSCSKRIGNHDL